MIQSTCVPDHAFGNLLPVPRVLPAMPTPPPDRNAPRPWWWVFDPRQSLRARAALCVGGGAMLFAAVLGWSTTALVRRSIEKQLGAHFETLAVQVSDKLDRTIFERYRTLQLLSNLPAFRQHDTPPAERRRALEIAQQASPDFAWLGFADPAGRILAATGGRFEHTEAHGRTWFRGARERPFSSSVREDAALAQSLGRPTANPSTADADAAVKFLDLAVPVSAADGPWGGVLAAHVRWSWSREVQQSVVPENAARELLGVTVYAGESEILLDNGGSGWTDPPPAPALPDLRRARGVMIEHAPGGTVYLTGFARSRGHREFRGLGWLTTVRQPVERAFAPVAELRQTLLRWSVFLVVATLVMSWLAAAWFSRQLRRVAVSADRIREGDILAVLPRPPGDGELARMCGALGDLVEDLRAKEQARTAAESRGRK